MCSKRFWRARRTLAIHLDLHKYPHACFVMAQASMAFPILNTFIHYPVARKGRRCRSAPAEIHVDLVIAGAIATANSRKPKRRRRRGQPERDDQAIISEFRAVVISEKWHMIAQKLATRVRKLLVEACNQVLAHTALARLPSMRETIPTQLFMHIANSLGISQACFVILFCEGILRRNGTAIEIWAPEVPAREIKLLLAQSRRFKKLQVRGEFLLRLPMGQRAAYSPIPLGEDMTVNDLKAVAAVCCGSHAVKLSMTHLGEELMPPGLLVEKGVGPGSFITVTRLIES